MPQPEYPQTAADTSLERSKRQQAADRERFFQQTGFRVNDDGVIRHETLAEQERNMIDLTGVDLVALAKAAYDLSSPQGLGFLHATPAPLTDEEARSLVNPDNRFPLSLDYVRGRAVKLTVFKDGDALSMNDSWYDHSDSQLRELLARVGRGEQHASYVATPTV